MYLRTTPIFV